MVVSKEIGLEINADKTKYILMYWNQIERRNHSIKADNISFERVEISNIWEQISIQEEIKNRWNSGNACYHSVQNLVFSSLVSNNLKK
jgi:hypothetical protein